MQNKKDIAFLRSEVEQLKNVVGTFINHMNPSTTLLLQDSNLHDTTPLQHISSSVTEDNVFDAQEKEQVIEIDEKCPIMTLEEMEVQMITSALKRNNGHRALAAKELGISERTLYRKISDYNIEV